MGKREEYFLSCRILPIFKTCSHFNATFCLKLKIFFYFAFSVAKYSEKVVFVQNLDFERST